MQSDIFDDIDDVCCGNADKELHEAGLDLFDDLRAQERESGGECEPIKTDDVFGPRYVTRSGSGSSR